jgi:hypothetical protein
MDVPARRQTVNALGGRLAQDGHRKPRMGREMGPDFSRSPEHKLWQNLEERKR